MIVDEAAFVSFNPRLPGGRRPPVARRSTRRCGFNPRLPGGRRRAGAQSRNNLARFNPRLPGGRRRRARRVLVARQRVSIHAFRGEGDSAARPVRSPAARFNPRLPGGRRQIAAAATATVCCFNPRLPGGRRRKRCGTGYAHLLFQSTPSGGKATQAGCEYDPTAGGFNPRLPGGRRRGFGQCFDEVPRVSIHAFRGEGDATGVIARVRVTGFNPRLPGGRRLGSG